MVVKPCLQIKGLVFERSCILRLDRARPAPGSKRWPVDSRSRKLPCGGRRGVVWFSDVTGNVVRQWSPSGVCYPNPAAGWLDRNDDPPGSFIGPNGMCFDKDGAVLLCQHGNRRIVRTSRDRKISTLVDPSIRIELTSARALTFGQMLERSPTTTSPITWALGSIYAEAAILGTMLR
jgi:hypothetical protein